MLNRLHTFTFLIGVADVWMAKDTKAGWQMIQNRGWQMYGWQIYAHLCDFRGFFQVTSFSWSHDGRMALICYQVSGIKE